ncbi:MAG: hypothetical protein KAI73_10970, partial [Rhodospirillaceae bacterium]|nr:hypothetical protein [Rhodospirillaceae bacterium]
QGGSALRMHDDTTPTKTTLSAWLRVDLTKREAAQHKIIVPHIEVAAREFTKIWWVQNDVAYRIILDSRFAEVDINNTLVVWRSTGGLVAAIALARYQATRAGYVLQVTPMDVGRAWAKYLNEDQPGRAIVLHALATPCAVRSNDQWAILTRRAMSHRHVLTALGQAVTAALTQPHTVVKPPTAEEIKRVMTEEGDNTINQIDIRFGQPHTMVKAAVEKLIASGAILVSPAGYLSWAPAPAPGPTAATLVKWGMVRAAVAAGHDTPTAVGNAVYLPQGEVNGILQTLTGFGLLDMTQAKHLSIPGAPLATITAQRGLTVQRWAVGAMALVVERTHDSAPVWHVDTPWGNLAKGHQGPALALWCVLTGKPDPDCAVAPVLAPDGSGLTWRGNKRQVWIMTQVAGSRGVALSGPRIVARVFPCAGAALRALLDSTGVDLLSPQAARIIF